MKGFKGSHGAKIGYLKTFEGRWAALPSHARTPQPKLLKWTQDFIRQNRRFYEDNKAWIDPWLPKIAAACAELGTGHAGVSKAVDATGAIPNFDILGVKLGVTDAQAADGKRRSARVVGVHRDHVALQDAGYSKAFKVHDAAILTEPTNAPTERAPTPADVDLTRPAPPPEAAGRGDFRVGN